MNYPIWETAIGGGTLIAIIAVVHVYIAHLAVGGGLFLWLTDRKGFRENNPKIHQYVKSHTWFFLLLTMVFGGMTGVGIWFIISVVHPAATSKLIHSFVFGWAIEWVFFVGEIVALLIYHYKFEQLGRKNRLTIAFLYFLFAWLSLVIINGIIAFMLTPGKWLLTQNFWHGFFNPTYFPSLFFRTFIALMFAGLFGYVTAVFLKDDDFRMKMLRYCSKWLLFPVIGLVLSGIWYYFSLSANTREITFQLNPQTNIYVIGIFSSTILMFLFGIYFSLKTSKSLQKVMTFVLVIIGLLWMGSFEYIREIARKPFVINEFMYSNAIEKSDEAKLNREGVLAHAKWTAVKSLSSENQIEAGREIFRLECSSCHTTGGTNDVVTLTNTFTYTGMISQLTGQGNVMSYMPKFIGTTDEKAALAAYLVKEVNNKELITYPNVFADAAKTSEQILPFDQKSDEYILLAWNDLGMHCISDCDPWFVILPPANTLEAQLIKRGEVPEIITEGIEISYEPEPGFENPAKHVRFWEFAKINYGADLEPGVGLAGFGIKGAMQLNEETSSFHAKWVPVVSYQDDGTYNPYPFFTITAKDKATGEVLARTKAVAPNATEMGCRNCHGGNWSHDNRAGVSDETAINILKAHDANTGTNLYEAAQRGEPKICQACHADPAVGAAGDSTLLNLSAAMHGWHANYMHVEGADACRLCHPAHPQGSTRCNRSIHATVGLNCVFCHGTIADHALSLLKAQEGKKGVERLMQNLEPKVIETKEEITPRLPWINEPDCITCHVDYEKPTESPSAFNQWTESLEELYRMRTGNAGIRCEACHSSTHAEYPATNPFSENRDNFQPMQYSGAPYPIGSNAACEVCHKQDMEDPIHHENMLRPFRNIQAFETRQ